ncbi:hypothetical protein [Streptomyces alboflavus]|uniref:hypothetical protein n=1 Tax=Streptomyces alboflavus TaxID=67267 RepID=UPI000F657188|nr:hypothetical protein [Streptomyces alboflavus]
MIPFCPAATPSRGSPPTGGTTLGARGTGRGHVLGGRSGYADRFRYRFRHGTVWHGVLTAPCHRRRPGQLPVRTRRFV